MSAHITSAPFDQNDKKYRCLCGHFHITLGARIVSAVIVACLIINVLFSLTRSTSIALYSLFTAAFAAVIYGGLVYGVFKEKRLYVLPYLGVQAVSVALSLIALIIFLFAVGVNSSMVPQLAEQLGGVTTDNLSDQELNQALAVFTVEVIIYVSIALAVQIYCFDVIFSFYQFLRDREASFNFAFEGVTTAAFQQSNAAFGDDLIPPAYATVIPENK